jgi:indole-3-glycerol phosphate synthase
MVESAARPSLTRILEHKRAEVARQLVKIPLAQLNATITDAPPARDFAAALRQPGRAALIAEVKQASPSCGALSVSFDPLALARTYAANGAAAIAVLTDVRFFQGSLKYLEGIRALGLTACSRPPLSGAASAATAPIPLLRKDFIIDPYQISESRAYGADAVLLISAALDDPALAALLALTHKLGMQALVEVHDEAELARALVIGADLVCINNHDPHSFVTTLATTERLAGMLPTDARPLLVSEGGIATPADVARVRGWGADAVLVGSALISAQDVAAQVRELAGII